MLNKHFFFLKHHSLWYHFPQFSPRIASWHDRYFSTRPFLSIYQPTSTCSYSLCFGINKPLIDKWLGLAEYKIIKRIKSSTYTESEKHNYLNNWKPQHPPLCTHVMQPKKQPYYIAPNPNCYESSPLVFFVCLKAMKCVMFFFLISNVCREGVTVVGQMIWAVI